MKIINTQAYRYANFFNSNNNNKNNVSYTTNILNNPIQDTVSFASKDKSKNHPSNKKPDYSEHTAHKSKTFRKIKLRMFPERYMKEYLNKDFIQNSLNNHYEEISGILGQYGYTPKIDMSHLEDSKGHFLTTYNFANNLTGEGGFNLDEKEKDMLLQAALLHDIGKALIPDEIFNKPGKFTPKEREIMDLHSELSYILLKDSDLNGRTLNAIRMHHHNESTGDKLIEILSLCDEASALKESRVYKKGFTDKKTKAILKQDVESGKLDPKIVKKGLTIMSPKKDD